MRPQLTGVGMEVIFKCYDDVLHKQGKEYIISDILEIIKKQGVKV